MTANGKVKLSPNSLKGERQVVSGSAERRLPTYPSSRLAELLTEIQKNEARAILSQELKKRDALAVSP